MKTAIVYDYVPALGGGAERALLEIADHFSEVDLYFGFVVDSPFSRKYLKALRDTYGDSHIHYGPTLKFFIPITFRIMNYLLPTLLQSFDLQQFDLVISYSAFIAHSITPPEKGKHFAYLNTPARFLWNLTHSQSTLKQLMSPLLITDVMRFRSQLYDMDSIYRVDKILSISQATADRVKTFYNKPSTVIYPASVSDVLLTSNYVTASLSEELGTYFTHVSRVESYKNLDLLLDTVIEGKVTDNIVIMGNGPYLNNLMAKMQKYRNPETVLLNSLNIEVTKYGNVLFTGYIDEAKKMQVLATASASFSLNDEDFGITKVESLAVGTPVIGLVAGATPEIIKHGINGVLFSENTPKSLSEAISIHKTMRYDRKKIIESAKPYTISSFHTNLEKILNA